MNINLAICDDDVKFLHMMSDKVGNIFKETDSDCTIHLFDSGNELIDFSAQNTLDIVLIDIDMPQLNGFDAVNELQKKFQEVAVIFITSHEEFAIFAYDYQPFWFLSKQRLDKLDVILLKFIAKIENAQSKNVIRAELGSDLVEIDLGDVMYLKSNRHYVNLYTPHGEGAKFRCSLKEAYDSLGKYGFLYINRSHIVNFRFIKKLGTRRAVMKNGCIIPMSRDSKTVNEARKKYGEFMRSLRW